MNIPPSSLPTEICRNCPTREKSILCNASFNDKNLLEKVRLPLEFKTGEVIPLIVNGAIGFHIVKSGKVKIRFGRSKKLVRIEGPGKLIGYGEWDFPGVALKALEDVATCFVSQAAVSDLISNSNPIAQGIIKCLARTNWLDNYQIVGLSNPSVKARVANTLKILNQEYGIPSKHGSKINLQMSRKILAELSGTVTATLARTLTQLVKAGIIYREGWVIHVVSQEKLDEIV